MKHYVADFETTTTSPARVWAWGVCEIGKEHKFTYDNNLDTFFDWCKGKYKQDENKVIYFHNLEFDGQFIFHWLLTHDFIFSEEKLDRSFNCLISDTGQFYSIDVTFKKYEKRRHNVTFLDSKKKLPFSVKKIGKDFDLGVVKGEIDYSKDRPIGYQLDSNELDYLMRDVQIVAKALDIQYKQGLKKMTNGSDALGDFKNVITELYGKRQFEYSYPVFSVEIDMDMRQAYRGGFTYLKEGYKEKTIGEGLVYDVNSLYPSVMYDCLLPYGVPIYFVGQYQHNDLYPLYIQSFSCTFSLKKNHLPTLQLKNSFRFSDTEYLTESGIEPVHLVMTNIDLELFMEHYFVDDIEWVGGFMFKGNTGFFKEYIDKWVSIKETSTGAIRQLAKLMLNSLYGKFASNPRVKGKYPYLENNVVRYGSLKEKEKKCIYTPLSIFVTSYARDKTIRTGQDNYDRFIYADTDSLHLLGTEPPDIDIHPTKMGFWALEGTFSKARFLKPKLYAEEIAGNFIVKGAGMTDSIKEQLNWDNFYLGHSFGGKLQRKNVEGGTILKDIDFTIK